ncbi:MAG: Clp protease ClpP [Ferrovibrio sp.]|uniref:head maturation protease, ClpP-related n=1 Tax=Ferrovibrio sp. TaxID=1917215 RepID=UPI002630D09C|nr:head maturation protease, ClpP-related [Ferrovibrio sp.]MCW0235270.1 Clp protease ClpP [Ferrovibrio sp.]
MDKIDIAAPAGERRERFFARAVGTKFAAKAGEAITEIELYDEIGYWGVTAKGFRARLKETTGDIVLKINSPGGDVFDGIAIYNDLLAYDGKVRVEVTGMAASIASIIAMAGDEVILAENAFLMIHNAWTIAVGNRHDFGDTAAVLAKIDDALARTYAARTKSGIREIKRMMDDETWMTAKEAVESGFATSVAAHVVTPSAMFDLSVYAHAPKALCWDEETADEYDTEEDIEKVLMRDAGRTRTQARSLIKDIRAGTTTSKPEVKPGADDVDLTALAAALSRARAAIHSQS